METWLEYTSELPSPLLWRRWAGIFILAASMERRIWIRTVMGELYPNLYIMLVGPPGVGKTVMSSRVDEFLRELTDGESATFHLASSSVTAASLVDDLREAGRRFILPNMEIVNFNSLTIVSNELGVLLPEYDPAMMSKLTDIYDGKGYSERRRTKDLNFKIDAPQINLIAATTPSFLTEKLPPGAWDQGFLSRTMIVFSTETMYRDLFADTKDMDSLRKSLAADLTHMYTLFGKMTFTAEAIAAIQSWDKAGRPPLPDHPKLLHYNTRRAAHLLKLCMVACMATGDSLSITIDHFQTAMDWLIELEVYMPDIFKAMNTGGDSGAMEDAWYHVAVLYGKEKKPIHESRIIAYLAERIPAQNVARVLDLMVKTGIFISDFADGAQGNWYVPRSRK